MKINNAEIKHLDMKELGKVCRKCDTPQAMKKARDRLAGEGCPIFGVVRKNNFPHLVYAAVSPNDDPMSLLELMETLFNYQDGTYRPESHDLNFEQVRILTDYGYGFSAYMDEDGLIDIYYLSKAEDELHGFSKKKFVAFGC